jgi:hypothetical protein
MRLCVASLLEAGGMGVNCLLIWQAVVNTILTFCVDMSEKVRNFFD